MIFLFRNIKSVVNRVEVGKGMKVWALKHKCYWKAIECSNEFHNFFLITNEIFNK